MNPIARQMTLAHIKATGYARNAFDRMRNDDRGQGTLEYVGIVIAVVALVVVIIGLFQKEDGIGQSIVDAISDQIKKLTGATGD